MGTHVLHLNHGIVAGIVAVVVVVGFFETMVFLSSEKQTQGWSMQHVILWFSK